MRIARGVVGAVLLAGVLAAGHGGCGSPTTPPPPTTTTSTTTTSTTSTTSTSTTTTSTTSTTSTTTPTTTTTTTTTMPSGSYSLVHPIWASRGCTGCHTSNNRLNLSGNSSNTCALVRNGTDIGGGQYLDNPLCTVNGSSIIFVPSSGLRPGGTAHPGGMDACFGGNGMCRQTILAWCTATAVCP